MRPLQREFLIKTYSILKNYKVLVNKEDTELKLNWAIKYSHIKWIHRQNIY